MESPETSDVCIICNKSNALRCKRCKSASYCSKSCQRGDFPIHKLLCAKFSAFDILERPTEEHVRAILFPVDQRQPNLIWLHCRWKEPEDEYDRRHQSPNSEPYLNDYGREVPIQYNNVLARRLSNTVCVSYRDTFLIDGSAPNRSIEAITDTIPGYHHDWRGPIIAYGKVGPDLDPEQCRDIDMNDFRHIADYLNSYGSDLTSIPAVPPANCRKVKGVKINCLGDQKVLSKPHFEEIELSANDIIFRHHETSDIAKRIGLPILTKRCFPHPTWANIQDWGMFENHSPYNNQDATFLHLSLDQKTGSNISEGILGFGWAPTQWQNNVGTTVVVRQDKKPLLPMQMEVLCSYCRYHARDCLAHTMGEYAPDDPMSKGLALSMICRPTFSIWWYRMCNEKHKKGESCDAPFPYSV